MWQGAEALLLTEYFENKEKLNELKGIKDYFSRKGERKHEEHYDKEIREVQNKIIEFISSLDSKHLKSIIYMSIDMDVEVCYTDKILK